MPEWVRRWEERTLASDRRRRVEELEIRRLMTLFPRGLFPQMVFRSDWKSTLQESVLTWATTLTGWGSSSA